MNGMIIIIATLVGGVIAFFKHRKETARERKQLQIDNNESN